MKKMGRPSRKEIASIIRLDDDKGTYYFFIDQKGNLRDAETALSKSKKKLSSTTEDETDRNDNSGKSPLFNKSGGSNLHNLSIEETNNSLQKPSIKFPPISTLINKVNFAPPKVSLANNIDFHLSERIFSLPKLLEI